MSDLIHVNRDIDAHYSPDDDGWYCQEYPSGRTTAVFDTWQDARDAALAGEWGPV